ncbi:response regulator [Marinobacterium sp. D7]|uniref:PAS domain-containing hybrid sensor histidine kinase/response regulator n=1 Tax=Marinobacterium ramblicola TaxID=2849041 RepID=UPI001C2D68D2|nr:NahK/ErcS family hybrid sensor histidine kinase/response regulator [Marinobacterium ramblicola]MBV1789887.1 response regulator [Marinobacterium ramblicola]
MKKPSEPSVSVDDLIGLGGQSARKSYYPALQLKIEELETERNRYKWLFENALHGIFQANLHGSIEKANPALARICGVETGVSLEQDGELANLLEGGAAEFAEIRQQLMALGQLLLYQTRLKQTGGGLIHVSMNLLLRQEEDRTIIEGFVSDITERVRMQNQMQAINEALEQRVSERTQELLGLNERLREEVAERQLAEHEMALAKEAAENANRSKDKYLAAASHDLLQPLNAARLLVSTLRERELAAYEGDLVERVHRALSGAEHLLSDLLDISKLDQNAVQPDVQTFPLSHLLRNMEAEFQSLAEEAGLEFRIHAPNLSVRSDLRLLSRILRNLIGNAIRYTDSGKVLLSMRRRGDQVLIQVWDTGPGIPAEQREEIFLEFRQLKNSGAKRGGVGLGLAIVDRIARVLECRIQLDSIEGKGSRFGLMVPLAESSDSTLKYAATPGQQDSLRGAHVLVVDNEPEILVSMRALLEGWGCKVDTAQNLDEAVEQAGPPNIILADYHLDNDETGLDAVRFVREHYGRSLPAAILTADRSGETRRLFREAGLTVLNKPLKPGKLRALMHHLLEQ